ncbi:hypothetical protein K449DRAFT_441151 [Hypoxylon sp. EC38]|nr:hypothetical protein K449DRAFT_441151 [Hypoxylon sp. EC38]
MLRSGDESSTVPRAAFVSVLVVLLDALVEAADAAEKQTMPKRSGSEPSYGRAAVSEFDQGVLLCDRDSVCHARPSYDFRDEIDDGRVGSGAVRRIGVLCRSH